MIVVVSGSVGSGKSTLAKKLAKSLKFSYLDVNKVVKREKLYDSYDKKTKSYVVDVKKLNKFLIKYLKGNLIVDSHLSHYLPKKYVDLCIITTCDISELRKRLKKRKYSAEKIKDNMEVEIFDTFVIEAKEKKYNLLVVDTTKGYDMKGIKELILKG